MPARIIAGPRGQVLEDPRQFSKILRIATIVPPAADISARKTTGWSRTMTKRLIHRVAQPVATTGLTQNGIHEARYVRIGGIEQWIQIRGDDRSNPVLLWLSGGPGFSTIPSTRACGPLGCEERQPEVAQIRCTKVHASTARTADLRTGSARRGNPASVASDHARSLLACSQPVRRSTVKARAPRRRRRAGRIP